MSESPRILRKKTGHFLEDFRPGQVFRHKGGNTVTEGLFTIFTEFSMTTNPLAKNARYARAYGFEGLVCPPGLVMLIAFSQTVEDVSENAIEVYVGRVRKKLETSNVKIETVRGVGYRMVVK